MRYWPSVRSRWLDIDRGLFLWTETKSRSVKTQKGRGPYPAILTEPDWLKNGLVNSKKGKNLF